MTMDTVFEARLIECLAALEAGEPMEQILTRHPEDAARLRPILEVAAALPTLTMEPRPEAAATSRRAFLAEAEALRAASRRPRRAGNPWPVLQWLGTLILVLGGLAVLLAVSDSALPGNPLYGLKRGIEGVQLVLAPSGEARSALERRFNQERIKEIRALLGGAGAAQVEFEGIIEVIQPDSGLWQVSGLPVWVDSNTQIVGTPLVGSTVRVRGVTEVKGGNLVQASLIAVVEAGPAPSLTPTVSLTPAPSGTATPTPQPTPTPTPTPTPLPAPTATPLPAPSLAPEATEEEDSGTPDVTDTHEGEAESGGTSDGY